VENIMLKSQEGFSLLEVIVSISLLSIILLSFFSFFIQAANFTSKNKDVFDAGQYSQELLEYAQAGDYTETLTTADLNEIYTTTLDTTKPYFIIINNRTYFPKVIIETAKTKNTFITAQTLIVTVIIEIENGGQRKEIFKTYGYK
jgi:prepilin-type N-terminal cleavage/methylation domain-containing protein